MKKILIIFGLSFQLTITLGQNPVDTVELWNYDLEIKKLGTEKSIGQISFWRIRPINDEFSLKLYGKHWTPNISYDIFNLSDSAYCFKQSLRTKMLSSCVGPDVGGDIIIIGNYIFLNRDVCLNCIKHNTGVDYCRTVIKVLVNRVDNKNARTLDTIVGQFGIKESDRIKASR